jgi:hypothetical protein
MGSFSARALDCALSTLSAITLGGCELVGRFTFVNWAMLLDAAVVRYPYPERAVEVEASSMPHFVSVSTGSCMARGISILR